MLPHKHPRATALIAGLVLAALPAQTQACWLFDCFGHHSRTTFYAPVAAVAPACAPCAQQTVRYVPQTAYRPLVTTTPVTAMRPVISTDPCTGCATTAMHPTTTYMQRTVLMPYTTYRPVIQTSLYAPAVAAPMYSAPACSTGGCAPAATTTYYQPAAAPAVISQPGCCAPSAPTFGQISTTITTPSAGVPVYGGSTGTSPAASQPKTFSNGNGSSAGEKSNNNEVNGNGNGDVNGEPFNGASAIHRVPEIKDNAVKSEPASLPELRDPLNRTTSTTTTARSHAVAWNAGKPVSATSTVRKLDDSGWEAAR